MRFVFEVPTAEPLGLLGESVGTDPFLQLEARDALRAVAQLPERYVEVLSAIARGELVRDFADERGMDENAAWSRLRLGRAALAKLLAGRGWRRR